jgi:hypothetical protein
MKMRMRITMKKKTKMRGTIPLQSLGINVVLARFPVRAERIEVVCVRSPNARAEVLDRIAPRIVVQLLK